MFSAMVTVLLEYLLSERSFVWTALKGEASCFAGEDGKGKKKPAQGEDMEAAMALLGFMGPVA